LSRRDELGYSRHRPANAKDRKSAAAPALHSPPAFPGEPIVDYHDNFISSTPSTSNTEIGSVRSEASQSANEWDQTAIKAMASLIASKLFR
jgi:hypothetical protein